MTSVSGVAPRRRLTRAEQQARTRGHVLDAADAVFAERGFHAARVEEIAERAGYTRGAVYSNFRGKDDLALAIIERRIESASALLAASAGPHRAPVAQAQSVGERVAALFEDGLSWGPLFLEFAPHAARHPELHSRLVELYRELAGSIARVLEAYAGSAGATLPVSTDRLAMIMLAASDGAALERFIDPERADSQLLGEMLGWIVTGLAAGIGAAQGARA